MFKHYLFLIFSAGKFFSELHIGKIFKTKITVLVISQMYHKLLLGTVNMLFLIYLYFIHFQY